MKTNTFIAFSFFLLVLIYVLVMHIKPDEYGDMSRFIPNDTLIYFEQHDQSDWVKRIANSRLGKKIKKIDFIATGKKIGLSKSTLEGFNKIIFAIKQAEKQGVIREIFGKKIVIALLHPLKIHSEKNLTDFGNENIVVVTEPQHNAKMLELAGMEYGKNLKTITLFNIQYGNHRIKRIRFDNETLSIVVIDGYFVMSFNERQLRRCIDVFDSSTGALFQDKNFLALRKNFNTPTRFLYIPLQKTRHFLITSLNKIDFSNKDLLLKELKTTTGFNFFGYGAWQEPGQVNDKIVVQYDTASINDLVRNILRTPPSQCTMFSLVSENPMLYYWSNTFDFHRFIDYLDDKKHPDHNSFLHNIELAANMNIDDVFSLLEKDVSFVLEKGASKARFPIPLAVIFIKVKQIDKVKQIFTHIIGQYKIPMIRRKYGALSYYYWAGSFQDGMQPLYGFWKQYLFIANSSRLLKTVIDHNIDGKNMLDGLVKKRLDPGLSQKNNSVTYTNNVDLLHILKQSLNLVAVAMTIQNRSTALKMHRVIEDIIRPLLEGLEMYNVSVTRSFFSQGEIIIETRTNITAH